MRVIQSGMEHPVLLYDGVCALCNWTVRFVLRHDQEKTFRFAPLQSPYASRLLAEKGVTSRQFETAYIAVSGENGAVLLQRSDAVLFVLGRLGAAWKTMAWIFKFVPRRLRDWAYGVIARSRYRIFGKYETCPLPSENDRERFISF